MRLCWLQAVVLCNNSALPQQGPANWLSCCPRLAFLAACQSHLLP